MTTCPYGFRIVGAVAEERRLVDADAAFRAYAACDDRAHVEREAYLSAFTFGADFRALMETTGSCRGFAGPCCSPWLWFDIDRADLDAALADARRLALTIQARFRVDDDALLLFFSGAKGFHLGLATSLWQPPPSPRFNGIARRFAETLAAAAGVRIDGAVYDKVRAFRAPNSRHPRTGLHKRRLSLDELLHLSLDGILTLATTPEPFDVPMPTGTSDQAAADWHAAAQGATTRASGRHQSEGAGPRLNRATLDFIRDGASEGDRAIRLFCAAANLAEFGCPPALAHALLTEAALDSGLTPSEVRRQIDCGLAHAGPPPTAPPADAGDAWEPPPQSVTPPPGVEIFLADAKGRPCDAATAVMWTWAGAERWFAVADHPLPFAGKGARS